MSKIKKTDDDGAGPMDSPVIGKSLTVKAGSRTAQKPGRAKKGDRIVDDGSDDSDVPIPVEKNDLIQTTVKISSKLLDEVEKIATETGYTRNRVLEFLISFAIRKHRQAQKRGS